MRATDSIAGTTERVGRVTERKAKATEERAKVKDRSQSDGKKNKSERIIKESCTFTVQNSFYMSIFIEIAFNELQEILALV
ncbi:hypothetical protein [Lysinibacillus sp. BPa_S21]|uniref:hypothetical protein n=1 Tax=Lysinibacillus sp. BPa_S21 TaxID=2932478 RepID=UPI002013233A|nr:hypothetical protein [Lysinibacillus sp. BPa_S21]MCL1694403.1 hypothetical protein [Lysinibacillus sp. BPa_S21]